MAVKEAFGIPYADLAQTGLVPETINDGYQYYHISGFSDLKTFLSISEAKGYYRERGDELETDETFGQIIMYGYHLRDDGKFFLYQRGNEGYDESRLAGQVSVGIGGHMERTDLSFAKSFKRELAEEAHLKDGENVLGFAGPDGKADIKAIRQAFKVQPRGILRDGRRPVDRVHVGVVVRLIPRNPSQELQIIDNGENIASQYVSLDEYEEMVESGQVQPEMWTDAVIREEIVPLLHQR